MRVALWCLIAVVASALTLGAMFAPPQSELLDTPNSRRSSESISTVFQNPTSSFDACESAAHSLALVGTSADIGLLKQAVWQAGVSLRTRCEIAIKLVEFEVPEGLEFLLTQYDLYRLERRMTSRFTMDPVREALERLDSQQLLVVLEQRLKSERDLTMQNNIRTLSERVRLNQLPVAELQKIAADTNWKKGMYRRYPAIEQLGRRGDLDMISFLNALEPWQSDASANEKQIEGQNKVIMPELIKQANAAIEARHANKKAQKDAQQEPSTPSNSTRVTVAKPEEVRIFRGHTAPVHRLSVSPNGRFLVSVAYGHRRDSTQTINEWIIWDLASGKIMHRGSDPEKQLNHQLAVTNAAFLPDSQSIFRIGKDCAIWDIKTSNVIRQVVGQKNALSIVDASLSPDGKYAVGWWPGVGKFALWDMSADTERMLNVADARLAQFLPDGRLLLSGGSNGNRLRVFDIKREMLGEFFMGESTTAGRLRVSPDGKFAVTTISGQGDVAIWDIAGQQLSAKVNQGSCACFAPNDKDLLVGRFDGTVSLAQRDTGKEELSFSAQRDVILDVAYSPDGQNILTTGGGGFPPYAEEPNADYAVRLWQLPKVTSAIGK